MPRHSQDHVWLRQRLGVAPCRFQEEGCSEKVEFTKMRCHVELCDFGYAERIRRNFSRSAENLSYEGCFDLPCKVDGCQMNVPYSRLSSHLKILHEFFQEVEPAESESVWFRFKHFTGNPAGKSRGVMMNTR